MHPLEPRLARATLASVLSRGATLTICAALSFAAAATFLFVTGRERASPHEDPDRPQFHYTPERNWLNDPNGLVYHDGEYHLFYQHNPSGPAWAEMISWGHAVGRDLVHWSELPVAIPHEGDESIFSGSAVVDERNTSGFGAPGDPAMVAIYTSARPGSQAQSLAYSTDDGRTWKKYGHNPVLDIGSAEFRDPKVFWYEPDGKWIMTVALPQEHKIAFYSSPDLKRWTHLSDFGPAGAVGGVWECPDLVEMPVDEDTGDTRWMLTVSLNPGSIAGGSGTQYFLGRFDGRRFQTDEPEYVAPAGDPAPGFEAWTASGDAFQDTRAGAGPVDSFHGSDAATGTLTSPSFRIRRRYVNLQVGGGSHPDTAVRLIVDGAPVRTAGGRDSGQLDWVAWDVGDLEGRDARIEIVDARGGEWAHVLAGGITFADAPAQLAEQRAHWLDYGADYYAAVSFNGAPGDRPVMIGWMNNWLYANETPTAPWRGAMSTPRELALRRIDGRIEAVQRPVAALSRLRGTPGRRERSRTLGEGTHPIDVRGRALDIEVTFTPRTADRFGLEVRRGAGERTVIGYDARTSEVFVDRTRSGRADFGRAIPGEQRAPLAANHGEVRLRVLVDSSSVEVFAGDGERVITDQVFPAPGSDGVALFAAGGSVALDRLEAYPLR
jgi:sucrose-6-phosphate hydrolase SacC (GH32 family)